MNVWFKIYTPRLPPRSPSPYPPHTMVLAGELNTNIFGQQMITMYIVQLDPPARLREDMGGGGEAKRVLI